MWPCIPRESRGSSSWEASRIRSWGPGANARDLCPPQPAFRSGWHRKCSVCCGGPGRLSFAVESPAVCRVRVASRAGQIMLIEWFINSHLLRVTQVQPMSALGLRIGNHCACSLKMELIRWELLCLVARRGYWHRGPGAEGPGPRDQAEGGVRDRWAGGNKCVLQATCPCMCCPCPDPRNPLETLAGGRGEA